MKGKNYIHFFKIKIHFSKNNPTFTRINQHTHLYNVIICTNITLKMILNIYKDVINPDIKFIILKENHI